MNRLAVVLSLLVWAGASPVSAAPAPVTERPLPAVAPLDLSWWGGFGDPQLDALLTEALAGNSDVKTAASRLGLAESFLGEVRVANRPFLDLDGGGGVRRYRPGEGRQDPDINRPILELSAGYEIDFWGRLTEAAKAGVADWQASTEDVTTVRLSLAAEVATAWFSLRANTAQLATLAARREQAAHLLALQQSRIRAGLESATATLASETALATLDRERASLEESRATLVHQLAALRGLSPAEALPLQAPPLDDRTALAPPADLNTGLLARRPDVRAASLRLRAQQARVGVARAASLPAITLLGKGFFTGDTLREFLRGESLQGFLAAQISTPLLDGGRNRARLESARAELTLTGSQYAAVVVRAFQESADAVSRLETAQTGLTASAHLLTLDQQTLALAGQRLAAGLADRRAVLEAGDQLLAAQADATDARLALIKARIALARSLAIGAPPESAPALPPQK